MSDKINKKGCNCKCCYKCDKRHVGCHADCEDYLAFRREKESHKKNVEMAAVIKGYYTEKYKRERNWR